MNGESLLGKLRKTASLYLLIKIHLHYADGPSLDMSLGKICVSVTGCLANFLSNSCSLSTELLLVVAEQCHCCYRPVCGPS